MNPQDFLSLFTLAIGVKLFLLTFTLFYAVLSVVILRQTQLMTQILNEVTFSPFLKFLALVNLLIAIGVFILAILTL